MTHEQKYWRRYAKSGHWTSASAVILDERLLKKKKNLLFTLFATLLAAGQVSAIGAGAWVGYNFAAGVDNAYCESQIVSRAGECSKGGLAVGGDLWLFGIPALPVRFGLELRIFPSNTRNTTLRQAQAVQARLSRWRSKLVICRFMPRHVST